MKNTSKLIYAAVQELAANKPETKEATAIVERLAQYHLGYLNTQYEWIESTRSHCFVVAFSGRLPIVAMHPDICTAIVLVNDRIMQAFRQPWPDLAGTEQSPLQCREVRNHSDEDITHYFTEPKPDRRTEYASAS
jgi:hypothetical protein